MIEIEKRGRLSVLQKEKFKKFLLENGSLLSKQNQLSIFIEFDNPFLGTIENTKNSINVSFSKDLLTGELKNKLKCKIGKMESSFRKEISIPFEFENKEDIFGFLGVFNISTGCPRFYYREDYKLGEFNISLKEKGLAPDHFEIELEILDQENEKLAEEKIMNFLKQQDLGIFSNEEYKSLMIKIFNENPPVPFNTIDFSILDS